MNTPVPYLSLLWPNVHVAGQKLNAVVDCHCVGNMDHELFMLKTRRRICFIPLHQLSYQSAFITGQLRQVTERDMYLTMIFDGSCQSKTNISCEMIGLTSHM